MAIGINPKIDFAFKRMLGSPEHTDVTVHFLNAVLGGSPRIVSVEILNPILEKETEDDKFAVLDVRARDDRGRDLNVEMQTALPAGMANRLTFYAARLFADQFLEGTEYAETHSAISICVLDAIMFREAAEYHLDFRLRAENHGLTLTNDFQIHVLELPKYEPPTDNVEAAGALEKWIYFLRHAESMSAEEIGRRLSDHEFVVAAGVLEMISKTPEERMIYDGRQKALRDEAARLLGARREAMAEGRAEGLAAGKAEGLAEGKDEGFQCGLLSAEIRRLQESLQIPVSTTDELAACDLNQLRSTAAELERRSQERRSGNN